jgi:hypothetical protein
MTRASGGGHVPETEIRDYGDHSSIVLFTRDPYTYRRFRAWPYCKREVTYTVGLSGKWVAADLYFARTLEPVLRRLAGVPGKARRNVRLRSSCASALQVPLPGFER